MKELPLGKVYQLIEPGPVVMLTTAHNCFVLAPAGNVQETSRAIEKRS